MAIVDTYTPLNMLNGFNFSSLLYADYYHGNSGWFTAGYSNGTNDTLWGYGFTYDFYGSPTGAGTVTGYSFFGNSSADLLIDISGISVPTSWIRDAALTPSTADDIAIIRTALAGADTVYGSDYSDVLDGFNGNDTIHGYAGNDTVYGEAGNDYLSGMNGDDTLIGGAGNDTLIGGAGIDALFGGAGKDLLTGSGGLDRMVFQSLSDSSTTFAGRDVINTFAHGDKIDLSAIDANTRVAGNQAFAFTSAFTGVAGQLAVTKTSDTATVDGYLVTADVNGDMVTDFSLQIYGAPALDKIYAWDFIL